MQLYFKKYGKGIPVIILHGLYGNSDNWVSVSKVLAEHYEVFIPDARNHGKSPHSEIHSFEAMKDDLLEFMKDNQLQKAIIIGHSMGGKTAMLFSLLHPEMVEKLIVVDIAPKSYKSLLEYNSDVIEHMNILNAFASTDISLMHSRSEIDKAFSQFVKNDHLRQFLLKNACRNENGGFFWAINVKALQKSLPQIMDWPSLKKMDIEKNQIPALFVNGEKSNYVSESDIPEIKKLFPQADFVSIFDAGHWVHAEQQELFLKAINL